MGWPNEYQASNSGPTRVAESRADISGLLLRLWRHLTLRRRRQLMLMLGLTVISAFAEVLSLSAVLPFIGVLISPGKALERPLVATMAHTLGITSATDLAMALTVAFVLAAIISGAIRLLVLWASTRLSFAVGIDLGSGMYRRTLYQPYSVHVKRNSSTVITGIANKTSTVVIGVVLPAMTFVSSLVVLVAIVAALLAIDPVVAVVSAIGFGMSYGVISKWSKKRLDANSERIAGEQVHLFKALQEGLGGIRDVLLDGTQPYYSKVYHKADKALREAQGSNTCISGSPRFAMEALGMALLALLAFGISRRSGIGEALPVLAVLALGAERLIPAMQACFASWSTILGSKASLADTLELLDQSLPDAAFEPPPAPLPFRSSIRFDRVCFGYSPDGPSVLSDLTLMIPKGARVGVVGATGSGKSTMLDLLLGLLEPIEGRILIDDEPLTSERIRSWQRNIAHVPQSVYLADATVAENIAFGVPAASIDMNRVAEVARQAQIADFIENSAEGYQSFVGERGVRISGGQRQRIGIARALYKQATVLVFDEATSALDTVTEQAVMSAIENLNRDLTIFIIAHRITTVRSCDVIFELDAGRAVGEGTYDGLLRKSESFRAMAKDIAS